MRSSDCWKLSVVVLSALALALASRGVNGDDSDLLQVVTLGTKQAVSVVQTGRGAVVVHRQTADPKSGVTFETDARYDIAFSGPRYRALIKETVLKNSTAADADIVPRKPGSTDEFGIAIAPDSVTYFTREYGPRGTIVRPDDTTQQDKAINAIASSHIDIIDHSGTTLPGNGLVNIGAITLAGEADAQIVRRVVGRESIEGSECIIVEISALRSSSERPSKIHMLWVDPKKGFTLPRVRHYVEGGRIGTRRLWIEEDCQMKEYVPGVWYPSKTVTKRYDPVSASGTPVSVATVTYDADFKINTTVGSGDLRVPFPSGTQVFDHIINANYTVP